LIVNITVLAAIYALLACGYVLIYRVSRVMNMAHGELAMLGAYLLYTTASLFVGHPTTAIAAAVVLSLTVGVLVYLLLMRKMTGEMVLAAILTTIAIGILLRGLIVLIWSAAQQHPLQALRFSNPSIELVGGARISTCAALMVVMTILVYGGLFAFLRFGPWGVRLRAGGQNRPAGCTARHQSQRDLCARLGPFDPDRIDCRHADRARFRARPDHGRYRAQGVRTGAGRRSRQPHRRAGRRDHRRRRRGARHPLHRSVALRRGAVPGAHRHPDRAPVGTVRHARGARPCLGNRAPAAISAPVTSRTSR